MKLTFPFLSFLLVGVYFNLQAQEEIKGSSYCSQKKMNSSLMKIENILSGPLHSFDVLDYKLDLDLYSCFISPYPKSFKGSVVITFKVDSTLNSISLDAVNTSIAIDSVRLSGISFTHTSNILAISLDRTMQLVKLLR